MTQPMTINAAIAFLTGPGSLTDKKLGCLGEQDHAAVLALLAGIKAQRAALRRIAKAARHTGKVAPTKGRLYRVASVCEAVHHVHASDEADAYHRMMCGEGTLIESDTHDTAITLVRK